MGQYSSIRAAGLLYGMEDPEQEKFAEVRILESRFGQLDTVDLIKAMVRDVFPDQIAVVSSFGAESAVLLHLLSQVDKNVPILFVDTKKHFGETKKYRDDLAKELGLTDVRSIHLDPEREREVDPKGTLFMRDPDLCCAIRKTGPLNAALQGFNAWISGRKRFQAASRADIPVFETEEGRIKVNPLADWTPADLTDYAKKHGLLSHPLVKEGYLSIGCMPCTDRVKAGEDARAGRWRGVAKIECGIHGNGIEVDGSGI